MTAGGDKYSGGWWQDLRHGQGVQLFANGSCDLPALIDRSHMPFCPLMCGVCCVLLWGAGDRYAGAWHMGLYHGQGVWTSKTGEKVTHSLSLSLSLSLCSLPPPHSSPLCCPCPLPVCVSVWLVVVCGVQYVGSWEGGVRHGKGSQTYANGKYEGGWKHGLQHGTGTRVWLPPSTTTTTTATTTTTTTATATAAPVSKPSSAATAADAPLPAGAERYVGEWVGGRRQGAGRQLFASGVTYDGAWHNDLPHGMGWVGLGWK